MSKEFKNIVTQIPKSIGDPAAAADTLKLYSKDVGGTTQLFGCDSDGTIYQITPASTSNVIVWGLTKTWAEAYAEITTISNNDPEAPIIVLVAYDSNGPRVMTSNGGNPTALWNVQFQSLVPAILGVRTVEIAVADEFTLDADQDGNAVLSSQDIAWTFAIVSNSAFSGGRLTIYLDGGSLTIGSSANFSFATVVTALRVEITNNASLGVADNANYIFTITAGGSFVLRGTVGAQINSQVFTAAAPTSVSVIIDSSFNLTGAPYNGNVTPTYTSRIILFSPDGTKWTGTVDNTGVLTFA